MKPISIKQSNLYSANVPGEAKLSGATAKSMFNNELEKTPSSVTSTDHRACWRLWRKGQVKEIYLQTFLEGSNWNGWMDRQWEVVPKRRSTRVKSSCGCVGLDPRDRQTNTFVWSQWMVWEWCGKHGVKINRLYFLQGLVNKLILNNILNLIGRQWRERTYGRLRVKGVYFVIHWASRFTLLWWWCKLHVWTYRPWPLTDMISMWAHMLVTLKVRTKLNPCFMPWCQDFYSHQPTDTG